MTNGSKINLLQMQDFFEGQVDRLRTISDLELSENDYRSLGAKLKSLCFFSGSENDIEDFMLSIVVYCTYSLIYSEDLDNFDSVLWMILNKSQYMERMHLRMYKDVFDIYGLSTYGITDADLKTRCMKLTAIHAGIPNQEKNEFYNIVSGYLECNDVDEMVESIALELPPKTRKIFDLMSIGTKRTIIIEARSLIRDVLDEKYSRGELQKKHQELSFGLIDHCIYWHENEKNRYQYGIN